ncbi:hypothetical protein ACLK29_00660 [Leptospira kirschneri]|uniref:hypothetical protein n=1 Tax=Leptospira kirschneri TaxID=29507 RepID=UPI00398B48F6
MSNWDITKLILFYTFWGTLAVWFVLAVLSRVIADTISFFSSWFRTDTKIILVKFKCKSCTRLNCVHCGFTCDVNLNDSIISNLDSPLQIYVGESKPKYINYRGNKFPPQEESGGA